MKKERKGGVARGTAGRAIWRVLAVRLVGALALAGGAGCQQTRAPAAPEGTSSFRFVEPPAVAVSGEARMAAEVREPVDVLEPAQPIQPLAEPVYPVAVRGKQAIPVTIGVRLVIAADGTVSDVRGSPLVFSTPAPLAGEFRSAVEAAVAQWRFLPAELRRMVARQGGPQGWYWHVMRVEKTESTVDVQFTFSATGQVVSERR